MKKRIYAALIDAVLWLVILIIMSSMFGDTSVSTLSEEGSSASFNLSGFPALVYEAV